MTQIQYHLLLSTCPACILNFVCSFKRIIILPRQRTRIIRGGILLTDVTILWNTHYILNHFVMVLAVCVEQSINQHIGRQIPYPNCTCRTLTKSSKSWWHNLKVPWVIFHQMSKKVIVSALSSGINRRWPKRCRL